MSRLFVEDNRDYNTDCFISGLVLFPVQLSRCRLLLNFRNLSCSCSFPLWWYRLLFARMTDVARFTELMHA